MPIYPTETSYCQPYCPRTHLRTSFDDESLAENSITFGSIVVYSVRYCSSMVIEIIVENIGNILRWIEEPPEHTRNWSKISFKVFWYFDFSELIFIVYIPQERLFYIPQPCAYLLFECALLLEGNRWCIFSDLHSLFFNILFEFYEHCLNACKFDFYNF